MDSNDWKWPIATPSDEFPLDDDGKQTPHWWVKYVVCLIIIIVFLVVEFMKNS